MISRGRTAALRGFTLVEMLIVLTITGLLTILVSLSFRTANDLWRRLSAHDSEGRELVAARDLVRDLLAQAYPAPAGSGISHRQVTFDGRPDRVTFLAPLRARFGAADIAEHVIRFSREGTLTIGWRLDRSEPPELIRDTVVEMDIVHGLRNPGFTYFGQDDPGSQPHWSDTWISRETLPALIRVRLSDARTAAIYGPDLVVSPRVTIAGCATEEDAAC